MVLCLKAWESRSLPGLQDPRERAAFRKSVFGFAIKKAGNKKSKEPSNHNDGFGRDVPGRAQTRPFAYQRLKFDL